MWNAGCQLRKLGFAFTLAIASWIALSNDVMKVRVVACLNARSVVDGRKIKLVTSVNIILLMDFGLY